MLIKLLLCARHSLGTKGTMVSRTEKICPHEAYILAVEMDKNTNLEKMLGNVKCYE